MSSMESLSITGVFKLMLEGFGYVARYNATLFLKVKSTTLYLEQCVPALVSWPEGVVTVVDGVIRT